MASQHLRLTVDIEVGAEEGLRGQIAQHGRLPMGFTGWLGLLKSLDQLIEPYSAARSTSDSTRHDDRDDEAPNG